MTRILLAAALAACVLAGACQSSSAPPRTPAGGSGGGSSAGSGGSGAAAGTGGATGGSGGGTNIGLADASSPTPVAAVDAAAASDGPADAPRPGDAGGGDVPDSDFLPGRPDIRLCKKEWSNEQCCAFLCSCLNTLCTDSAKAKPGLAGCMSSCPKLSSMLIRCHVYHCYISVSPTGGINDHDSHCGHAANQVAGGGCPTSVYQ